VCGVSVSVVMIPEFIIIVSPHDLC
jgi:hypothetical protein